MQSKMGRRSKFLQRHADDMCDLKYGTNEPIYKAKTELHPIPGAVRALRAHAGGVAVGVIIRIHPIGFVSSPHRLLLPDPRRGWGRNGKAT